MQAPSGQVRVGTCHWNGGQRIDPAFPGFTPIVCLTQSSEYGMLSPYCLTTPVKFPGDPNIYEVLVENYYQFSKVYEYAEEACEVRSRYDPTVIWKWPRQKHVDLVRGYDNSIRSLQITPDYLTWRKAGMLVNEPIRYPVGKFNMKKCLFSMKSHPDGNIDPTVLDYVAARKQIYLPAYVNAVKKHTDFAKLKHRLAAGENLLIIEVDCCQSRSLPYYQQKYKVGDDFIQNDTILINKPVLDLMLNDTKERFGHGYCLAGALLDIY